jgi:hypothetical protein
MARTPKSSDAEAAERERKRTGLAAEAKRVMADHGYVQEAHEVADLMEELRGRAMFPGFEPAARGQPRPT